MNKLPPLFKIENSIDRLGLSAFDPAAYPLTERRRRYLDIVRDLADLYDRSAIDVYDYNALSCRATTAYVHGGL